MRHKNLLCALAILLFATSCKDGGYPPTLTQEIAGEWIRADNPNRHYIFGDDFATTWIYDFGTTIAPQWFEMSEAGVRSIELVEINTGAKKLWKFSEVSGDTLCTVAEASLTPVFYFDLKRIR